MKIVSWNVNSVRARIQNILDYIKQSAPDIVMLQEIKTEDKNFPVNDFKNIGYESYFFAMNLRYNPKMCILVYFYKYIYKRLQILSLLVL